jgi:hypothetical protein
MLRSAALTSGFGTLAADEARIGAWLIRARQRDSQAEQFWMIAGKGVRRLAEETPAVMAPTAEALDGGAQHTHSVALSPHQVNPPNPCPSPS